ncbi:hypothetical protein B1222_21045 [Paenibacillus larvae subsp. pulvifaciens]|nr:hypothetical protein B1222_21045 [Paenibacillus larvae subsp. pulvifaciens]
MGALPIPGAKQGGKYLTKGTIELEEQLEKSLVSAGTSKYRLPMDLQLFAGRGKGYLKLLMVSTQLYMLVNRENTFLDIQTISTVKVSLLLMHKSY